MEFDQIIKLSTYVEGSKLKKLHLKKGDFELSIEKEGEPQSAGVAPLHATPRTIENPELNSHPEHTQKVEKVGKGGWPHENVAVGGRFIVSPMVGTFYASPAPDQPSFVKIGDTVNEDTVVCIVEAMKVMNEVKANMKGKVVEVLVDSSHPVEFGTKIFRVE